MTEMRNYTTLTVRFLRMEDLN